MTNVYSEPETKSHAYRIFIGFLFAFIGVAGYFGYTVFKEQKEDLKTQQEQTREWKLIQETKLENQKKDYENRIDNLKEEVKSKNDEIRSLTIKMDDFEAKYKGSMSEIKRLQAFVDDPILSNSDVKKELARLEGEAEQYKTAFNNANIRISDLEQEVSTLKNDLAAASAKIIELEKTVAIGQQHEEDLLRQLSGITKDMQQITEQVRQATDFEVRGDVLPGRRKFNDERFTYYLSARTILSDLLIKYPSLVFLNQWVIRLEQHMEIIKPGSTFEKSKKGF